MGSLYVNPYRKLNLTPKTILARAKKKYWLALPKGFLPFN